ncbi:MAG: RDD family protein [Psychroflexus salarius]
MDNYQIETAQNVRITQNAASVLSRGIAYLIDYLILIAYITTVVLILGGMNISPFETWASGLVITLPFLLYHLLMEVFLNGQSLGKMAMNIRVVMLDGSKPKFSAYLIRWLLRTIDLSLTGVSVAVLTVLINGKGQRLGDIAAKTTVISERRKSSLLKTMATEIPDNYSPVYPQVTIIDDVEMRRINSIFKDAKLNSKHNVILQLSKTLERKLNVKAQEKPVTFVETLIKDYNYYAQK